MRTHALLHGLALAAGLFSVHTAALAGIGAGHLRCEYRDNPQGIDETLPRLSWQLDAGGARGVRQTAYHILVASRAELLRQNTGDLWDSGKVLSDQSVQVAYAGRPLASRQTCFWKVRAFDQDGRASDWSAPASWTMGLLTPADWQAYWIGKDENPADTRLSACSWIGFSKELNDAPVPRFYRRAFDLPAGRALAGAKLALAGDNSFTCWVNGQEALKGGSFSTAAVQDIAARLVPGRNVLAVRVDNAGDTPNPAGLVGKLTLTFASGEPLEIPTDAQWKAAPQDTPQWQQPAFDDAAWAPAGVLGDVGMKPWGDVGFGTETRTLAARMTRKDFTVSKPVARATAYFSGLGTSELYLNGAKVGDAVLSPGLTHYTKRAFYVTYDVTGRLKRGDNALGVWLGNGRYYAPRKNAPTRTVGYGYPKLLLQLEIDYADGTRDTVVSDGTWRLTDQGPVTANNEYDGEDYDARREFPGWAAPGFDGAAWPLAQLVAAPGGVLSAQMQEPIRVTGTLKPVALTEPEPGVFVYDMGQNMVGWCRLTVRGPAGATVQLRHAETLQPDGTLYMANLRGAKVTGRYTLKGRGKEVYEPRFTYYGFRYVEVTGFPGRPSLDTLQGCVVNDDVASAGTFSTSQPTINAIYSNARWGTRGNYRSIPTDCPQRDERQGWLGDRSAESKGEAYLFDIAAFYSKWLHDMADAQRDDGSISDVCPPYWPLYNDGVTWPSTAVLAPGVLYEQYADTRIIERHYPAMVKWIDHMSGYIKDGIIAKDSYGDWCVPPEDPKLIHSKDPARKTSPAILGTAYFHLSLSRMAQYADLLGKPADAQRFRAQAETLKAALNARYYNAAAGYYDNGSQTACVLPLAFGLVPDAERGRVFDHLVKKITQETDGHIGTGLIGGQWLNRVLTQGGRADLAYGFATHTTYPSWGYMIDKGATTIWELWNGDTADPAMNSGNHVMLIGDLVIWFYETLGGIASDPAQPGFKHIVMRPQPLGDLAFVKAAHESPYGPVRSEWSRKGGAFDWRIEVPPNTSATVYIPASDPAAVTEGGKPLARAKGVTNLRTEPGAVVLTVGSGAYRFTAH
ncbi:MAG: glycoside hydrolase family 78 protein [Verrucomicrobiota bacterium]|jgi:alpha-L-rhamnosidase|nr:glycoside hydrolase family 78 protein [Verrucomicrobiota bacterium]